MLAVARLLGEFGPQLGRPYADTLNGSKRAHEGDAVLGRRLRRAILLVAGDNWAVARSAFTSNLSQRRIAGFSDHPENLKSGKKG